MKIMLADHLGFCPGVERAYHLAKNCSHYSKPVFMTGPLVHNTSVIEEIESLGIHIEKNPRRIKTGTVIIPSHGIDPAEIRHFKENSVKIVNATCPKVSKVMATAQKLIRQRKQVLIFGDFLHTEVRAINASIENQAIIFSTLKEALEKIDTNKRHLGLIAQTTQNTRRFKKISAALQKRYPDIEVHDTICLATQERQAAALRLIPKVQLMLIIGSPQSANSTRLFEICRKKLTSSYFIDKANNIKSEWFGGINAVGITAGASTPTSIIESAINRIRTIVHEDSHHLRGRLRHETRSKKTQSIGKNRR